MLDVWGTYSKKHQVVDNSKAGLERLVKLFSSPQDYLVIIEETGVYYRLVHAVLERAKFSVSVLNPYRSGKFSGASGKLAKTDKVDAQLLATYGQHLMPLATPIPTPEVKKLREFVLMRRQLIEAKKKPVIQSKEIQSVTLK
ncbi:MAG: hypothetical protein BGO67_05145 [Alphaproteobacteria bacterium 41-28]|nr:MAG: hypothetical protein BGO67_05145 [Alphaproteobacteria bacterium 41-28]